MQTLMDEPLADYRERPFPGTQTLAGRSVDLEPIVDERRLAELYDAFSKDASGGIWRWLHSGPFEDEEAYLAFARGSYFDPAHRFYAFIPKESGQASGVAALFRADLPNGVIELGHICLAPALQRTLAASEGFGLVIGHVLGTLGYRRLEWKCNDGNEPSKRAAERLGFTYEGLFRQHQIVKGENRDTAWYSMLDREWPSIGRAFGDWLAPENFDAGVQKRRLGDIVRESRDRNGG